MKSKQVLLYGYGEEEEAVCRLIADHGAEAVPVEETQLDETIGHLCGLPGSRKKKKPAGEKKVIGAVMVFHGFPQKELDQLLDDLRASGVRTRSLKAIVTPTNENWTLRALFGEIQEEQQVMTALIGLKKLRDTIPMPRPDQMELMMALMQAEKLLSGRQEVKLTEVEQVKNALLRLKA